MRLHRKGGVKVPHRWFLTPISNIVYSVSAAPMEENGSDVIDDRVLHDVFVLCTKCVYLRLCKYFEGTTECVPVDQVGYFTS